MGEREGRPEEEGAVLQSLAGPRVGRQGHCRTERALRGEGAFGCFCLTA